MEDQASKDVGVFAEVVRQTELPKELIEKELGSLITRFGKSEGDLTLEDLRTVMADYLQDVILGLKNDLERNGFSDPASDGPINNQGEGA